MTENISPAGDSMDGLIVRGRPPFAMTPTSLLRNPAVSSHAVRLWSVLASYTYGDQATDRPSRAHLAADVGWKSPRSVDGYLTELQDAGYLTVQRRWRPDEEQPPADQPPSPVRFHVPPTTGPTARATDVAAEADALVRVIRDRLPDRLRAQLSTATLHQGADVGQRRLDGPATGGGRC